MALKSRVIVEVNYIVNHFKDVLAYGKGWFINCLNDTKNGAVDLAKEVTENLNKCLQ